MDFFKRPYGVGAAPNLYMFAPPRLLKTASYLVKDRKYLEARIKVALYQLRYPEAPWLTSRAVQFLIESLTKDMRAFEWGSGRSTLWIAKRVRELVSVEHDPQWHERVTAEIAKAKLRNVTCLLASAAPGETGYPGQIATYPDGYFDFILVDGAQRGACIAAAVAKLSPRGFLVVDNADEDYDTAPCRFLTKTHTHNGVWATDIYHQKDGRPKA